MIEKEENPNTGHRERLKERFKKTSLSGFHDYEAIELLLTYAIPRRDVKPIAKNLLKEFKTIHGIIDASVQDLKRVKGIGENTANLIHLIKNLLSLYLKERIMNKDVLSSPKAVVDYLNLALAGEKKEKFMALFLNSKNEVLSIETLHEGTINQTMVYPRKAIEEAFKVNARSVIFVHNHPSGDPTPSKSDKDITNLLKKAASSVDIIVHDHLIIGKDSHFSARDAGWI